MGAGFRETGPTCDLLQRLKYLELLSLQWGDVRVWVPRRRIRGGVSRARKGVGTTCSTSWPCHPPPSPLHLNPFAHHPELQSTGPNLAGSTKTILTSFDLEILTSRNVP